MYSAVQQARQPLQALSEHYVLALAATAPLLSAAVLVGVAPACLLGCFMPLVMPEPRFMKKLSHVGNRQERKFDYIRNWRHQFIISTQ